jgi:hypothetical protein
MNDFSELESELKKLRPVQPSDNLLARIKSELAATKSTVTAGVVLSKRKSFNWLALGLGLSAAAAAILIFVRWNIEQPRAKGRSIASSVPLTTLPTTNASAELVPAGLTQVVYHARDEGVHFANNSDQPMRRVRSHTRETLQWRNPKTGATLRISYPAEQVSLLPVAGQ